MRIVRQPQVDTGRVWLERLRATEPSTPARISCGPRTDKDIQGGQAVPDINRVIIELTWNPGSESYV